ncbi:MAG: flagellar basal body-associated FliL family protein [Desulfobacterales bacterium]|uniref:Flagellar protein FliL n=1 Tax=Candidatus Desulfatibia vada TaxID=2841696 RepID=A0A8J6TSE5_9BACT|nr:flagellar basal body-associated FliL family protein [Candidatus Desulfatibia vada]MBL6971238.1 flagellar basal body-associated FliL family protein [Desulfobacterales bacterium]
MAAEEAVEKTEEAQPPPKSKLKLIVLASTVLLLGVGGFFGWKWYSARKEASAATQKPEEMSIVYPLKSFIVNLADKKGVGKRYLKVTMEIEVAGEEQRALVNHKVPQLRDTVLLMLSSRTIAEITTLESKLELKQILLARMNRAIGKNVIQRVYFTEFVVQ